MNNLMQQQRAIRMLSDEQLQEQMRNATMPGFLIMAETKRRADMRADQPAQDGPPLSEEYRMKLMQSFSPQRQIPASERPAGGAEVSPLPLERPRQGYAEGGPVNVATGGSPDGFMPTMTTQAVPQTQTAPQQFTPYSLPTQATAVQLNDYIPDSGLGQNPVDYGFGNDDTQTTDDATDATATPDWMSAYNRYKMYMDMGTTGSAGYFGAQYKANQGTPAYDDYQMIIGTQPGLAQALMPPHGRSYGDQNYQMHDGGWSEGGLIGYAEGGMVRDPAVLRMGQAEVDPRIAEIQRRKQAEIARIEAERAQRPYASKTFRPPMHDIGQAQGMRESYKSPDLSELDAMDAERARQDESAQRRGRRAKMLEAGRDRTRKTGFPTIPGKKAVQKTEASGDFEADPAAQEAEARKQAGEKQAADLAAQAQKRMQQGAVAGQKAAGEKGSAKAAAKAIAKSGVKGKDAAAYMAGVKQSAGEGRFADIMEELRKMKANNKKERGEAAGMALMKAGFAMMASKSPFFGTALGEGGKAGVEAYNKSLSDIKKADRDRLGLQIGVAGALQKQDQFNQTLALKKQALAQRAARGKGGAAGSRDLRKAWIKFAGSSDYDMAKAALAKQLGRNPTSLEMQRAWQLRVMPK